MSWPASWAWGWTPLVWPRRCRISKSDRLNSAPLNLQSIATAARRPWPMAVVTRSRLATSPPAQTPSAFVAHPIAALIPDDSIGPGGERARRAQAADSTRDGDPSLLEGIPRGVLVAGQPPGVAPQTFLPPPDQFVECRNIPLLATEDQPFIVNLVASVRHLPPL